MNAVSQWWIGGLRTRKAKVAGSIPAGGSEVDSSLTHGLGYRNADCNFSI